jgi:hypothetical protein
MFFTAKEKDTESSQIVFFLNQAGRCITSFNKTNAPKVPKKKQN